VISRPATRLLITADGGGSNGSRLRLWKAELAAFATEAGLWAQLQVGAFRCQSQK